jgi:hypothetical protein
MDGKRSLGSKSVGIVPEKHNLDHALWDEESVQRASTMIELSLHVATAVLLVLLGWALGLLHS